MVALLLPGKEWAGEKYGANRRSKTETDLDAARRDQDGRERAEKHVPCSRSWRAMRGQLDLHPCEPIRDNHRNLERNGRGWIGSLRRVLAGLAPG